MDDQVENTQTPQSKPKSSKLILALLAVLLVFIVVSLSFKNKKTVPEKPLSTDKTALPAAHMMSANFLPPASETVTVGSEATTEMVVKGSDASKKISGVQLKFIATGPVKIKDISLMRTDGGALTVLKKEITPTEAGIVGVIIENEAKLPTEVKVKIRFDAVSAGAVKFNLDPKSAQITGPIETNSYELSQTDASNFVIK